MRSEERRITMEWNKRKKSAAVIYGIAALVFVILVLVIPFSKPAASWVMFAFSIISFGLPILDFTAQSRFSFGPYIKIFQMDGLLTVK